MEEIFQILLMVMPIFASSASRDAIEAASDVHHFALDEALGQLVQRRDALFPSKTEIEIDDFKNYGYIDKS